MNRNMLNRHLVIADELDKYIMWWVNKRGEKPKHVTVTRAQMQKLEEHAVEGASLDNWNGVPIKVMSE